MKTEIEHTKTYGTHSQRSYESEVYSDKCLHTHTHTKISYKQLKFTPQEFRKRTN